MRARSSRHAVAKGANPRAHILEHDQNDIGPACIRQDHIRLPAQSGSFLGSGQCLMCLQQARRKQAAGLVIPPEIGALVVLSLFDHLPPDRAGAGEQVEQGVPSPERIARCRAVRSSEKRPSISSTAPRLVRNTSRHMTGSEAAMRVKSRKPPGGILDDLALGDVLQIAGGADDGVGDKVRDLWLVTASTRSLVGCVHQLDLGAERGPESRTAPAPLPGRCLLAG